MQLRFFVAMGADMQRMAALQPEPVSAPNVIDVSPIQSDRGDDSGRASEAHARGRTRQALASMHRVSSRERPGSGRLRDRTPTRAFPAPREIAVTDPSDLTVGSLSFAAGLPDAHRPVLDVTV